MPISPLHSYLLYNDYWSSATSNYLICVPQNVFKNMCIITILIDFIKLLNKKSFYNFITLILFYKIMYVKIYSFVFFEEEKEEETIWSHVYLHKMSIFCIRHRSNLLKLYFSYFFLFGTLKYLSHSFRGGKTRNAACSFLLRKSS